MPVKSLQINSLPKRAGMVIGGLIFLVVLYFPVKWCFGYEISVHSENIEVARLAVDLAPYEPQTHYALAVWLENTLLSDNLTNSLAEIEKATALSPHDFRLWLALGKSRWQNGDSGGAENALRKALELAPNYSEVLWVVGNFYLREGKTAEAFPAIRRAAEIDPNYTTPAISIAWQFFDEDVSQVKNALGDAPQVSAAFAGFLTKQKNLDQATEIWNALTADEKTTTYKQIGDGIFAALIGEKKYRAALEIQGRADEAGKITNGGFEKPVTPTAIDIFDWQISDGGQPIVGQNNETKHGGNSSLFLIFNSDIGNIFRQIKQTVVVVPGKTYLFECYYRTNFKTAAAFRWEIADETDGKPLAATEEIAEIADWTRLEVKFTAPENSEAIVVRFVRDQCKQGICSVSGKVWFDDFTITPL